MSSRRSERAPAKVSRSTCARRRRVETLGAAEVLYELRVARELLGERGTAELVGQRNVAPRRGVLGELSKQLGPVLEIASERTCREVTLLEARVLEHIGHAERGHVRPMAERSSPGSSETPPA